ncbi:MAG: LysM peptidoglycan-binding domain-containing protein [Cyclobacteriaceae bacterium]|nr:LysM peptidoglycan-binding domain-containing protein [Cyclobacteriaceae bacterium HetDA_MAG_MS6]
MNCKLVMLLVLVLTAHKSWSLADSIRMEVRDGQSIIIHQVDQKETLYSIAKRYNTSVADITRRNNLSGTGISIGDILQIPLPLSKIEESTTSAPLFHTVKPKETLYSISREYNVSVGDLKKWNKLRDNSLSVGQELRIADGSVGISPVAEQLVASETTKNEEPENEGMEYFVQTGETLLSISKKFSLSVDSIRLWNDLTSSSIKIGQRLYFPITIPEDSVNNDLPDYSKTEYGSKTRKEIEGTSVKVVEEGVARQIQNVIETSKYLALHRSLPIGTLLEVKNMMNNQKIYVRVVGKLPETGLNENVMVRLTPKSFERLGILDERALVEISYYTDAP